MNTSNHHSKNFISASDSSILDYLFVFVLIIYAGSATVFVRSISNWENLVGLALPILISTLVAFWYRVKISGKFALLLLGYLIYNLILTLKFNAIHPRFFAIYLISIFIAYITISALRLRFFIYYEKIIFILSIISIIFWVLHTLAPDAIRNLLFQFSFSQPGSPNVESNVIFYTVNNLESSEYTNINIFGISLIRNSGFAWEPGGFASFIDLAIFINMIRTKFRIYKNFTLIVLVITLITTFSTTGISIFLMLMIFFVYNQNIKLTFLFLPVIVAVGIYVSTLPFMTEKLVDSSTFDTDQMIENSIMYDYQYTPQRIESLQIDFIDFLNNPIFGFGGHNEERWTVKMGATIATISGIGKIISIFGLVGLIFFVFSLIKSSIKLSKLFHFKGWLFPVLLIIMIAISYSLIFTPLLMCFWLLHFEYLPKALKNKILIHKLRMYLLKANYIKQ